jgi:hypothetical protein
VTQFYKVDVDYDLPFYHVVGGTQDNNTQYGPVATANVQGVTNSDWQVVLGGDGHDNAIDPTDPNIIYCESQQGFLHRYDRKTGEALDIRPQPAGGEQEFRFNWDSPILISPHDPKRIYFGSRKLHRSDDRGDSWTTISPDLSKGIDRWTLPVMGRVWGIDAGFDLLAMSAYGNITSISESPLVEGLLYVGTDDGLIQVSEDAGKNWRRIDRFFDVPEGAFVNDVKADRHQPDTVYACLDHHKAGDYRPYLLKSTDRGRTWSSIASTLPERHLVWRIEQDHVQPNLLFVGTEFGVFASVDGGGHWFKFSSGMPTIPVRDLAIQKRENDLVAATFGRGFFVLDDYSPLRELTIERLEREAWLFPVRRTWWYQPTDRLGGMGSREGFQGDSFFTADNPTHGAVFTVHLKEELKSLRAKRQEAESAAAKANQDAPVPSLTELEKESEELLPMRFVRISDPTGAFVARVPLPEGDGLHRVSWDLKKSPLRGNGPPTIAPPGEYNAVVVMWDGKEAKTLSEMVTFRLEPLVAPTVPPVDRQQTLEFQNSVVSLQNRFQRAIAKLERGKQQLDELESVMDESAPESAALRAEIRQAILEAGKIAKEATGNPILKDRFIEAVPAPSERLESVLFGMLSSTHGPTKTHREQYEISKAEIEGLIPRIDTMVDQTIAGLRQKLVGMGYDLQIP